MGGRLEWSSGWGCYSQPAEPGAVLEPHVRLFTTARSLLPCFLAFAALLSFIISPVCLFCSISGYPSGDLRNRIKDSSILSGETSSILQRPPPPPGPRAEPEPKPGGGSGRGPAQWQPALRTVRFNPFLAENFSGREQNAALPPSHPNPD